MSEIGLDELGYDERLYILAFDHRGSFEKMVGDVGARPGREDADLGGLPARRRGRCAEGVAGVLVDGQYGPDVARAAKAGGYKLAMPVEKSGQNEFDFEYGDAVRREDRGVRPGLLQGARPLQPGGRRGDERAPDRKLRRLSEWLHEHHRKFLFELLVPGRGGAARERRRRRRPLRHRAPAAADDGGDPAAAERRRRGGHLEDRGHRRPRGVQARSRSSRGARGATACRASCSAAARRTRRSTSGCAPAPALDGYIGFAIGRSIFAESVKAYAADPDGFDRDAAVDEDRARTTVASSRCTKARRAGLKTGCQAHAPYELRSRGRSSVGRASASQAEGREFESHRPLLESPGNGAFLHCRSRRSPAKERNQVHRVRVWRPRMIR